MPHLLHWGVDVLSLCLEEAQHLLTLRDLRGESDQRLWRDTVKKMIDFDQKPVFYYSALLFQTEQGIKGLTEQIT